MNNIYRKLGAKEVGFIEGNNTVPVVGSNGSTNEATKQWAIAKLGFCDSRLRFDSWAECPNKTAVVPATFILGDAQAHPNPITNRPGYFTLIYASIEGAEQRLPKEYHASVAYEAMLAAIEAGERLRKTCLENFVCTLDLQNDPQFCYQRGTGWIFNGKLVKRIESRFYTNPDLDKWCFFDKVETN